MDKVLVTGGTGFIGSNLAIALRNRGYDVRVFRRPHSDLRAIGNADVEHSLGDIRDFEAVSKATKGCDTVFHTAAVISHWRKERSLMFDVNIGGTANVVKSCLETGARLVYTSSIAAIGYEPDGRPSTEETHFNWGPFNIGYRMSKFRAEQEVHRGIKLGLSAVVLNPATVIGPRDIHFHGGQIIRDVYRKKIFYSTQGGMNIVFVRDVVEGHLAGARQGRPGERYILCGENLAIHDVFKITAEVVGGIKPSFKLPTWTAKVVAATAETIGSALGIKPWVSRELVAGMEIQNWYSCEKARRELGYRITPFRQAVEESFAWYRKNGFL